MFSFYHENTTRFNHIYLDDSIPKQYQKHFLYKNNNEVKDNEDSSDGEPEEYGKDEDEDYKEDEE